MSVGKPRRELPFPMPSMKSQDREGKLLLQNQMLSEVKTVTRDEAACGDSGAVFRLPSLRACMLFGEVWRAESEEGGAESDFNIPATCREDARVLQAVQIAEMHGELPFRGDSY